MIDNKRGISGGAGGGRSSARKRPADAADVAGAGGPQAAVHVHRDQQPATTAARPARCATAIAQANAASGASASSSS